METKNYNLRGRKKIYTDEKKITKSNVLSVLQEALIIHESNVGEIKFLLDYEKGDQPLKRKKEIRKDIDIKVCDNVANEVTEFKLGYNWGNPITMVQRGNNDSNKSNPQMDDAAIASLNEMLEFEGCATKDQEMARYIEITGVGYRMIDIKKDYSEGGSVFDIITLNPLFSFVIYSNDALRTPMMGCTYRRTRNGDRYFTCITKDYRFEIKNEIEILNGKGSTQGNFIMQKRSGEKNPLGKVPIIEYFRSYDRMGCFERQISDMDNLNILISDFTNDVSQNAQAIWWGNDVDLVDVGDDGEQKLRSGMWLLTKTGNASGGKPEIKPLICEFGYDGVLANIKYRHDRILEKCNVPLQSDPGGGSTGVAMSMSSGWSAAETAACKQEPIIRYCKLQEIDLVLRAIKKSPNIAADSPLLELKLSDIYPRIIRNKTYDMATKANTFATYVKSGIHGRHALQVIDAFPDVQQTWVDSETMITAIQKSLLTKKTNDNDENNDRIMSDLSDQTRNSPITGGMIEEG